ncbi:MULTISPECIES: hypothetical protein [Bradyrhizobium]|nr:MULTISPECIES: hypothetical protein [Bradyrhizobium]
MVQAQFVIGLPLQPPDLQSVQPLDTEAVFDRLKQDARRLDDDIV